MPKYLYQAKSFAGETRSGVLEAKNERELAKILRKEGFILISAREKEEKKKFKISLPFFGGVSLKEKIFFTRNLQVMISAGTTLPRALRILAGEMRNENFKKVLLEIAEEIAKGKNFSEVLAQYPKIFSELFQSMVKIGEETGTLDEVLKKITQQMEKEYELKSRIKGALIYPIIVICAMVGIGILMLVVVVPKLAEVFQELELELPLATRIILGLGNFLSHYWYLLPLVLFLFILLFRFFSHTQGGKNFLDRLYLKLPIVSSLVKQTNTAYTLRNLSSLLASGVSMIRSLEIVSHTLDNVYFQKALTEAAEKIKKGGKLSEALRVYQNIYPPVIFEMIAVGEETGQTSEILAKLADFFEEEVSNATKNLASVIEPLVILLIGGGVGIFAISIIQPIYSVLQGLQNLR